MKLHGGNGGLRVRWTAVAVFIVTIPRGTAHLPAERIGASTLAGFDRPAGGSVRRGGAALAARPMSHVAGLRSRARKSPIDAPEELAEKEVDCALDRDGRQSILLADDNADMREYVYRLAQQSGYDVEAVADGRPPGAAARHTRRIWCWPTS